MPDTLTLRTLRQMTRTARHRATVTLLSVKNGVRSRINIENARKLEDAGLTAGTRFRVQYRPGVIEVTRDENGSHAICGRIDRLRDGSESQRHRLDLRSLQIHEALGGHAQALVLYLEGRVVILHLPTLLARQERIGRLLTALDQGRLETASLYSGLGTLDLALHEGFRAGGITSDLVFTNDHEERTADAMLLGNPAAGPHTTTTSCGIEELIALNDWPRPHFVAMGIPCKGASRNNTETRDNPEGHESAGHQFLNAVLALQGMDWPPLVLIENVLEYASSMSCDTLRRVLHEQGYDTRMLGDFDSDGTYRGLQSADFGDLERRRRMALLAFPRGLILEQLPLHKAGASTRTVADIRIHESLVDPADYDKGARLDAEYRAEKGRTNNIVEDTDTSTPCMTAGCYKIRAEDPKLRHPEDPDRWRLPVPEEHARLKGWPDSLIRGFYYPSHAHEALGNGVVRGVWVEIARALAVWLEDQKEQMQKILRSRTTSDAEMLFGPLFADL